MNLNDDEREALYQTAIEGLDVKYIDGEAYMSVHTVDVVNAAIAEAIQAITDMMTESEVSSVDTEGIENTFRGAVWVMSLWAGIHDELEVRGAATTIPDFVPDDLNEV